MTGKKRGLALISVLLSCLALLGWQARLFNFSQPGASAKAVSQSTRNEPVSTDVEKTSVVFAGLSGVPPQFFDEGPDKGFGWLEYETHPIRKALIERGFAIRQEWMTPARIEHEFKMGNPICTYPVKWKNPKVMFLNKPDRIYSIPLKLSGNETQKLIFKREDLPKFQRHFDKKGDLDIHSLLKDSTLKTLFVRGRDYGSLNLKVLDLDSKGDQVVRKEYSSHVILLLIKENRQLLEMLNARRFDYIFSDSIEQQDFKVTGISNDRFMEITYKTDRIGRNIQDENIVMNSIACSIHPISLKLIPTINEIVSRWRGLHWYDAISRYRHSIDEKYSTVGGGNFLNSMQFNGVFEAGGADYWYSQQQKFFPALSLFPPAKPKTKHADLPRVSHSLRWRALSEEAGSVTFLNESSLDYRRVWRNPDLKSFHSIPYSIGFYERYLSPLQRAVHFNPESKFAGPATDFRSLDLKRWTHSKKLTLFASGLSLEELRTLEPLFSELREIVVFGAGTAETTYLVTQLPRQLERLSLINCSLSQSDIHTRIAKMPLKALHLTASQVTQRQMGTLISNISESIVELSLAYHRGAFSKEVAQVFETRHWPHLTYLDLENCVLFDEHLEHLIRAIPLGIETLRLGLNFFYPAGLQRVPFHKFVRMKELDLSNSVVGSYLDKELILPPHLKRLFLWKSEIKPKNLKKIRIPTSLDALDLSGNFLDDSSVADVVRQLGGEMQILDLSGTGLGDKSLRALASGHFRKISVLNLEDNALGDAQVRILSSGAFEMERLSLKGNRIHNGGAELVAERWLAHLKALDISENPITSAGVAALAHKMGPDLLELSLNAISALDVTVLASNLPKSLQKLDLSRNQVSDVDMKTLAPHLPPSLRELQLIQSEFTAEGAWQLARFLPRELAYLGIQGTPIGSAGLIHISHALPSTLKDLRLGPADCEPSAIEALAESLPPALQVLHLSTLKTPSGDLAGLMSRLPRGLTVLASLSSPISVHSLATLTRHWPNNLRQLYFSGYELGDEKIIAMSHELPPSLERFALPAVGLGDLGLAKISENPIENVHSLEWTGNKFSSRAFNLFLMTRPAIWKVHVQGCGRLGDGFLSDLPREKLQMIRELAVNLLPLSEKGLLAIFSKLNPNFWAIGAQNARFTPEGVEALIRALPRSLRGIDLRGVPIGEVAVDRLRQYAKEREAQNGLPLGFER